MKPIAPPSDLPECHEGPLARKKFVEGIRSIVAVPKAEIERREAEYQKERKATRQQRTTRR